MYLFAACPDSEAPIHKSLVRNSDCLNSLENSFYDQKFNHRLLVILHLLKKPFRYNATIPTEMTEECRQFFETNIQVTNEAPCFICLRTVNQCDELWKNCRQCRITGSICYDLFTYCANKKPDWNKKIESIFFSTFKGDTRYGHICEPEARQKYELGFCKYITQLGSFIHPQIPWLAPSPDGLCSEDECLIEIKSHEEEKKCLF